MIEELYKLLECWENEAKELEHFKQIQMEFNNYWAAEKYRIEERQLLRNIDQLKVVVLSEEKLEVKRKLAKLNSK